MIRTGLREFAKASAVFTALTLLVAPPAAAQQKIDVASTASLFPQYYPLAVAEQQGYFKDENLTINEVATGGGGSTVQPIISGDTPIGLASMSGAILAKLRNAPIKVIAGASPNFLSTIVYAVAADSKITRMADLSGQRQAKVGYTSGGSITDVASELAVRTEKLKEGTDVTRVALGSMSAQAAALVTHQIQVATININAIANFVVQGKVRVIGDTGDYLKVNEANAIIANSDFIQRNPDAVKRFMRAYSKAVDYANTHKDDVEQLYADKASVSKEAAAVVFKKLTWTTDLKYEGYLSELNLLKDAKKIPASTDPKKLFDQLVDLSLLPKAP
jgi:ABC-type nitrate/sulfonate/bicarbonate transport system substrate-binding protein